MSNTIVYFTGIGVSGTSDPLHYWTCPAGVTSVTVEVWGSGGAGFSSGSGSGAGGGGGAYAQSTVSVTAGTIYTIQTGGGGVNAGQGVNGDASWFQSTGTVFAPGGSGGTAGGGGNGGSSASCVGTIKQSGGAGATAAQGGGGGGAGGPDGAGTAGSSATGATGDNGSGGAGGTSGGSGKDDYDHGGGGGGGVSSGTGGDGGVGGGGAGGGPTGGTGAHGLVKLTYTGTAQYIAVFTVPPSGSGATSSGTWTCPSGVSTATVECWGGGGGGHSSGDAGGGGGAYASGSQSVTAGTSYTFQVGKGGAASASGVATFWVNSTTLNANGGTTGGTTAGGAGGTAGTTGTTHTAGGTGASKAQGGGGGGAAGPDGAGNSSTTSTGATGDAGTGATGGTGGATNAGGNDWLHGGGGGAGFSTGTAGAGGYPGGGGGGGSTGGVGGAGLLKITYTVNTTTALNGTLGANSFSNPKFGPQAFLQGSSGADYFMQSKAGGSFSAKMSAILDYPSTGMKFGTMSGRTSLSGKTENKANLYNSGKYAMPLPSATMRSVSWTPQKGTFTMAFYGSSFNRSNLKQTPNTFYGYMPSKLLAPSNSRISTYTGKAAVFGKAYSQSDPRLTSGFYSLALAARVAAASNGQHGSLFVFVALISKVLAAVRLSSLPTGKTTLSSIIKTVSSIKDTLIGNTHLVSTVISNFIGRGSQGAKTPLASVGRYIVNAKEILAANTSLLGKTIAPSFVRSSISTGYVLVGKISAIFSGSKNTTSGKTPLSGFARGTVSLSDNIIASLLLNSSKLFSKSNLVGQINNSYRLIGNIFSIVKSNTSIIGSSGLLGSSDSKYSSRNFPLIKFPFIGAAKSLGFGNSIAAPTAKIGSNILTITRTNTNLVSLVQISALSRFKNALNTQPPVFVAHLTSTIVSIYSGGAFRPFVGKLLHGRTILRSTIRASEKLLNQVPLKAKSILPSFLSNRFGLYFTNPNFISYKSTWENPWKTVVTGPEMLLSPKDPLETVIVTFDFTSMLASNEALTTIVSVVSSVYYGTDGSPSSMLAVQPIVTNSFQMVQPVQGGLDQVTYKIKATVRTNRGQILTATAILPVVSQ